MKTKRLVEAAVIAAVYAAVTLLLEPLSYGVMQIRVSEALTVLPFFTPAAVPGLFLGCLLANIISPFGIPDLIFGSLATLIAALLSYFLRERPILVPLPPVIINGLVIGSMLHFVYAVPLSLPACIAWVSAGQFVSCYLIGYPAMKYLKKFEKRIFAL